MMKTKLLKIIVILFGGFTGFVLVGFGIYVILYYPRKAESFEIIMENPTKKILIATQGSDYKNMFVKILTDSLKKSSVYIKGMDVGELTELNEDDWDKVLIINSFIIKLNKNVDRIITKAVTPGKNLVYVTSGGSDWLPHPEFRVDAFTSASKKSYINDLVQMITDWIDKENNQKWEPDDYLLALNYFPQIDVKVACEMISSEQERYQALYPDLRDMINRVGYQYIRLKHVPSALEVFRLNISLFPDYWNVYDSYGEALLKNGDRELAIENYRKALDLNPDSKSANDMLQKLCKE